MRQVTPATECHGWATRWSVVALVALTALSVASCTGPRVPSIEVDGVTRIDNSCAPAEVPIAAYSNGAYGSSPHTWTSGVSSLGLREAFDKAGDTGIQVPGGDELDQLTAKVSDAVLGTFPQRTSTLAIRSSFGEEIWAYVVRCEYRIVLRQGDTRSSLTIKGSAGRWEFRSFPVDESGRPK